MMGSQLAPAAAAPAPAASDASASDRIVDVHLHFDEKVPAFLDDFLRVSDKLHLTACMLTPFEHRKVVADAARKYPHTNPPVWIRGARCPGRGAAGERTA